MLVPNPARHQRVGENEKRTNDLPTSSPVGRGFLLPRPGERKFALETAPPGTAAKWNL
jgi:hypothetical protein